MRYLNINPFKITQDNSSIRLATTLSINKEDKELWFSLDKLAAPLIDNEMQDAALLSCILPAMKHNVPIHVRGKISPRLHYHLSHSLIPMLAYFMPDLQPVSITADEISPASYPKGSEVITGFSAGIDSFSLLHEHNFSATKPYPISYFLFNNVGSHGQGENDQSVFHQRFADLKVASEQLDIPLISVDSNLDEVINMPFRKTHTINNAIAAMLLQKGAGTFLYASSISLFDLSIQQSGVDISTFDSSLLPLLGSEKQECILVGGQLSRLEKTQRLIDFKPTWNFLDVCVLPEQAAPDVKNCSRCPKCLRTLFALDLLGALERYDQVFDLSTYHKLKKIYTIKALSSDFSLMRELSEHLKKINRIPNFRIRLLAKLLPCAISSRITTWFMPRLWKQPRLLKFINTLI